MVDNNEEEEEPRANYNKLHHEQSPEPEEPARPRPPIAQKPPAVRKLDSNLDKKHLKDSMVGSVMHKHCIGSVIREYTNLEAI